MNDDGKLPGIFQPGDVVAERYEILEPIGQGTTGIVYRARDLHVDSEHEIVALKAIHPHLHGDKQIFGRFRREVKILSKLEGPHLCKLLECVEEHGLLLISLEYVDGPSLDAYLEERSELPLAEVNAIMAQICGALTTAHTAGVVHRDLKPSNVLIEGVRPAVEVDSDQPPPSFLRDLSVRVVDFGLAKLIHGDHTGTVLTEQDMIFGTPDYMAPEQVSGEELDGRCDVYAAGVILYEMLVGKLPYDTPGPLTTMAAHLNSPVPVPSEQAPQRGIGKTLERIVMKALAKKPEDRYPSAAALAEAIAHALEHPDAEPEELEDEVSATTLEIAETSLSTTLTSPKEEQSPTGKGAKVQIVVKDAVSSIPPPRARRANMEETVMTQTADGERRLWMAVAFLVACAAVALGVWLGMR